MRCRIVKLNNLSGKELSVYSIVIDDKSDTLFESFILENIDSFKSELLNIITRIKSMSNMTGAREQYFKLFEGSPGDGVCALYDSPEGKLRLYCIRYGSTTIILGSGGKKPGNIRSFQENEKLSKENFLLRDISMELSSRIRNGDINLSKNSNDFTGLLEFTTDEEYY